MAAVASRARGGGSERGERVASSSQAAPPGCESPRQAGAACAAAAGLADAPPKEPTDGPGGGGCLVGRCRQIAVGGGSPGGGQWAVLTASLLCDVRWLQRHGIMDYSLLLGIAREELPAEAGGRDGRPRATTSRPQEVERGGGAGGSRCYSEWCRDRGGMRRAAAGTVGGAGGHAQHSESEESSSCRYYYYVGIIDVLQTFDTRKAAESLAKQFRARLKGHDPALISAVDAQKYGDRFVDFMIRHFG